MTLDYAGAGDGQCLALKSDGEQCTNGVYGTDYCCGTHKNATDVTLAPDEDDRDWFYCDECGWQPADSEHGDGSSPHCSHCGVEFGGPLQKWGRDNKRTMTDGGVSGTGLDQTEDLSLREEYKLLGAHNSTRFGFFVVRCSSCGDWMHLGYYWSGLSIPACPDCNDSADSWGSDPRIAEDRAESLKGERRCLSELVNNE